MHQSRTVAGWIIGVLMFVRATHAANDPLPADILDDPRRLEAYVGNIVSNRMEKGHVPGAVVTIARGNKVIFNKDPAKLLPLRGYLRKCLPLRWHPAGEAGLYTDHGITLAGYVIEEVSGKKFQNFVEASVMRPLGMESSHYAQLGEPLGN